MGGWVRLWIVLTLAVTAGLAAFGLWQDESPRNIEARWLSVSDQVIEEMGKPECKQVRSIRLGGPAAPMDDATFRACVAFIDYRSFAPRLPYDPDADLPNTPNEYRQHVGALKFSEQRRAERFYLAVFWLPAAAFAGLWAAFFLCRGVGRWVAAGFRRAPAG